MVTANWLFRSLEMRCQESTVLDRKIAHDLTATHTEIVCDSYPSMVARKFSWEFHLIANMLPLFSHSGTIQNGCVSTVAPAMRLTRL
jgi:hypothetical protein